MNTVNLVNALKKPYIFLIPKMVERLYPKFPYDHCNLHPAHLNESLAPHTFHSQSYIPFRVEVLREIRL